MEQLCVAGSQAQLVTTVPEMLEALETSGTPTQTVGVLFMSTS